MTRGVAVCAGALAALLAGCTCQGEEAPAKGGKVKRGKAAAPEAAQVERPPVSEALARAPNVLLIVWDTVRADHMSAYGYAKPTTPRVAEWSKQGIRYDRAVSPGVWTLPSHASLFTGLPERGHGVNADHNWLDSGHLTMAESLSAAGY
ncbi:MAG TPA: sulfatase-like hydrolase/transferase, partial [Myxococcota bacterium]|nr:sulfatase-like hydrolase/transferase [Myxococcota bacterium]